MSPSHGVPLYILTKIDITYHHTLPLCTLSASELGNTMLDGKVAYDYIKDKCDTDGVEVSTWHSLQHK